MAEDLAIDVGIPIKTDEFHTFVSCVNNIIDHGCSYSGKVTAQIRERCEMSELPLAKKVLRACQNTLRPSKLKWWEKWRSKRESDVPRWPAPSRPSSNGKRRQRSMSPMFKDKRNHRPMSPMFKKSTDARDKRYRESRDDQMHRESTRSRYHESREPDGYWEPSKKRRRYQ